MEIVSYLQAREVLLLNYEQILPLGGLFFPDLLSAVGVRYEFSSTPPSNLPIAKFLPDGAKFETGKLALEDREVPIQEFTIYSNGIVAVANKTEDAQALLDDFFSWAELMFEMRAPETSSNRTNRLCGSQLV